MIFEGVLSIISNLIIYVLDLLPNIPTVPDNISNSVFNFINLIFNNVGLLGIFLPLTLVKIIIPIWIAVEMFDKIYSLAFWIIRKIPILNIKE